MGEVVDMTGRVVVADEHPAGCGVCERRERKRPRAFACSVGRGT
jgi:hypothetical protein